MGAPIIEDSQIHDFTRAFSISEQRLRQEALDFSESRLAGFLQHLREDEQALSPWAMLSSPCTARAARGSDSE